MENFKVGDRVTHKKESILGTIISIDYETEGEQNYFWLNYQTTTCLVQWDDNPPGELDIQWLNKLELYPDEQQLAADIQKALTEEGKTLNSDEIEDWLQSLAEP